MPDKYSNHMYIVSTYPFLYHTDEDSVFRDSDDLESNRLLYRGVGGALRGQPHPYDLGSN